MSLCPLNSDSSQRLDSGTGTPYFFRARAAIHSPPSLSQTLSVSDFPVTELKRLGNLEKGLKQDKAAPLLDKLVFNKIKQGLGGQIRLMLSGAAPLSRHVEEFLRVAFGAVLSQGYGSAENRE